MPAITRKQFMQGALGTLLASEMAVRQAVAKTRSRPNVLFVIADEWRSQAFGYAGDTNARTPAIDKFSAESINFENAIAGTSVCCPSRASLMTGQYALTHGVYINDVPLQPKGTALGEAFARAGYDTGYIGKWHLYGSPDGRYGRRLSYIPPEKRFGFEYWKACECTHDYNHSLYYDNDDPRPKFWDGYDAIAQTKDACQFIRTFEKADVPFFLFLSWGPPHFPLSGAPKKYQDLFKDRDIALRPNVPEKHRQKAIADLRGYYAHGAALDDCFQSLLDTLEQTGMADNTIVVFTSDHGDMMYSQGLAYKMYPWEESIRIPLLVRYPKKFGRKGTRTNALIDSPDIMPTLLGLSGLAVPKSVQGVDFSGSLSDSAAMARQNSAFLSMPVPITSARSYGIAAYRGVRTQRYTYVRSRHGPWLLYDNVSDPYQKSNLCGQAAVKTVQEQLDGQLHGWLHRLDDKFRPPEEYLERDGLTHYIEPKAPIGNVVSPWGDWESTLKKPAQEQPSIDSAIGDLLAVSASHAILIKFIPDFIAHPPEFGGWRSSSLRFMSAVMPARISATQLKAIDTALEKLPPMKTASGTQ